jgi:hypothetical protein
MADVQIAVIDQQDTQIVLAVPGIQGPAGPAGPNGNMPSGGTTGQVIIKQSATNYNAAWSSTINGAIVSFNDGTF